MNSIIPQSDDKIWSYLLKEIGLTIADGESKNELGIKREEMLGYYLIGLITLVGTEPIKVIMRRNIGYLALSFRRLITASIIYIIYGVLLIVLGNDIEKPELMPAFNAGAMFYFLFSATILILGVSEYNKAKVAYNSPKKDILEHLYRGDSFFFSNKDSKKTWTVKEPVLWIVVSLLITIIPGFYNYFLLFIGIPLLFTAISFAFNEWFQTNNVWDWQTKKIIAEQEKMKKQKEQQSRANYKDEEFGTASSSGD